MALNPTFSKKDTTMNANVTLINYSKRANANL